MRTNSLIVSVALLLTASLGFSAEFESSTARIAAWNLEGFNPIPVSRLQRQAEGIAIVDAEVITLVEVNPDSAMADLKTILADDFDLCYNFEILPQDANQNIAVMVKCGITIENPRFIDGSDLGVASARKALVVDVTVGEFDFTIIAVHLKSGRSASDQATRDAQAQVIGAFITDFRTSNSREDILIRGDFNMVPGQDVSNFHFLGGDEMDFISNGDLQDRFSHILDAGRANLLDGFAITRTFTTEYNRGSLRVFPLHWAMKRPNSSDPGMGLDEFRQTISDHLPFVASFKITDDAD